MISWQKGLAKKLLLKCLKDIHGETFLRRKLFLPSIVLFVLLISSLVVLAEADSVMWYETYGGTRNDVASSLVATSDGGYAIAGGTYSFGVEGGNFWLLKSDESGIIPEYSSWIISSLLFIVITFALINKKRLLHPHS